GVEHRALRGVAGFNQGSLPGDRHALGDRADFHDEIEREELLRRDSDAAAVDSFVALESRRDLVVAWVDVRKHVLAAFVGHRRALDVRLFVGEGYFHAGYDTAGVFQRAANTTLEPLSEH